MNIGTTKGNDDRKQNKVLRVDLGRSEVPCELCAYYTLLVQGHFSEVFVAKVSNLQSLVKLHSFA